RKFAKRVSAMVPNKAKILDAGAGECAYRSYFSRANYISQDLCIGDPEWDFSQIDIKSDIYDIPVEESSFDFILCMEVLEHLRYPDRAFQEFSRILKPEGKLFLVCPLTWGEHQKPYDYFRYTQFVLKSLASENNFETIEIKKQGGKFIVLNLLLTGIGPSFFAERNFINIGRLFQIIFYPIIFPFTFIFYFLDKLDKNKDLTLQYECIFTKKK
ncbi:MAG: methyltransferase domain-containing protein, partial [Candidatus Moranbacteria bacterium]|nr:methyltransferase domain-containing protein [Candidatus Moranbacteria bacterium]